MAAAVERMSTSADESLYNKIDTFVFFDLETADMISRDKLPKITELSMVATPRRLIQPNHRNALALPRIMHKLTIPICPNERISDGAARCSNLFNQDLEDVKPFDEDTYDMIMHFIDRLPGLVCFVAHNGNNFDYPIFLREIQLLQKSFPDRVLCVDSWHAFREFYNKLPTQQPPTPIVQEGIDEVDEEELMRLDSDLSKKWNNSLCDMMDNFERVGTEQQNGVDVLDAISLSKNQNNASSGATSSKPSSTSSMQIVNERTPENQIVPNSRSVVRINPRASLNNARRSLNFNDTPPRNFKLGTIYMHMIGREAENAHTAEGDCISMLRCVCQIGPNFAEWADQNAISMNHFKR
ncbi:hypothetical protein QAD02_006823 [Eretmocerus hayati]|uniref:Uncharacterized protein n=1 Tax=Eretmocerus hayati TaxID=131215 RepID=A0ACC2N2S8_9HYME|nr:hypothetical protein QAD02_006823 [Eretmocerus hayati]